MVIIQYVANSSRNGHYIIAQVDQFTVSQFTYNFEILKGIYEDF